MWKRLCPPLIFVLLLLICSPFAQEKKVKKFFRIGVAQFSSSQAFDKDQKGFEKALAEVGFKEKANVIYDRQSAQGDIANAQTIAQKFLKDRLDLIHTIAPSTSQAVVKIIKDVPVVFSSVTHPVDSGLVPKTSLPGTKSGTNVTGVSYHWPVQLQVEMYTRFVPKAKKWGTIYNAGDTNSLLLIEGMREAAKKLKIELIEAVISNSAETMAAAQFMAGKVQAIHITYDTTAVSGMEAIVRVCNEKKIPLFTSDVESVCGGAIAAYGVNFFLIGYSAGRKAVRILKGEEPGDIPWGRVDRFSLAVNEKAAKAQGVIIPPDLLKKSDKIISN
jgi:putative ABC transport system substrate-binding protein